MPIFETVSGSRLDLVLPDTEWPELQKAVSAYRDLFKEKRVAAARLGTLNDERVKALEADRAALAKAIRTGKADPGSDAVEKIDKEIEVCKRRYEALDVAIEDVEMELLDVLAEHREAWLEDVEKSVATASRRYEKTIEPLNKARLELAQARSLRRWLTNFPETEHSFREVIPSVRNLMAPSGDPYGWAQVVAALQADAIPPEAQAIVIPWGRAADASLRRAT
jgi:hypothetical protein